MSVEHYHCESCEESIYEEYVGHCAECQKRICTFCTINNEIDSNYEYDYRLKYDGSKEQREEYGFDEDSYEIGEPIEDVGIDPKYCPFCIGNQYTSDDLLNYLLAKYNLTEESVKEEYFKNRQSTVL